MSQCKVCGLLEETRNIVNQQLAAGVPVSEVRGWLQGQGLDVPASSLNNHRLRHLETPQNKKVSTLEPCDRTLGDLSLSSGEAHKLVVQEMLAQIDRLRGLTVAAPNLRVERLLSESLFRTHQALSEVSYD